MTHEEAINSLETLKPIVEWGEPMEYQVALDLGIEALEGAEKYKWHDLREAPEDLPEVGKPFVYALHVKDIMADLIADKVLYYIAMGLEEEVKRMEHQGNEYAEYIAWMYFDPFEGEV